jgi:hypothetical protein
MKCIDIMNFIEELLTFLLKKNKFIVYYNNSSCIKADKNLIHEIYMHALLCDDVLMYIDEKTLNNTLKNHEMYKILLDSFKYLGNISYIKNMKTNNTVSYTHLTLPTM